MYLFWPWFSPPGGHPVGATSDLPPPEVMHRRFVEGAEGVRHLRPQLQRRRSGSTSGRSWPSPRWGPGAGDPRLEQDMLSPPRRRDPSACCRTGWARLTRAMAPPRRPSATLADLFRAFPVWRHEDALTQPPGRSGPAKEGETKTMFRRDFMGAVAASPGARTLVPIPTPAPSRVHRRHLGGARRDHAACRPRAHRSSKTGYFPSGLELCPPIPFPRAPPT